MPAARAGIGAAQIPSKIDQRHARRAVPSDGVTIRPQPVSAPSARGSDNVGRVLITKGIESDRMSDFEATSGVRPRPSKVAEEHKRTSAKTDGISARRTASNLGGRATGAAQNGDLPSGTGENVMLFHQATLFH